MSGDGRREMAPLHGPSLSAARRQNRQVHSVSGQTPRIPQARGYTSRLKE